MKASYTETIESTEKDQRMEAKTLWNQSKGEPGSGLWRNFKPKQKIMKKIIGYCLLSLPLWGTWGLIWYVSGFQVLICVVVGTIFTLAIVFTGLWLISQEK